MNKALLGIDLGTSSVKVLLYHPNGKRELARAAYEEISPKGWLDAMARALAKLDTRTVGAVSLSSQTGTYVVNDTHVIPWSDPAGKEELPLIRGRFSGDAFLDEIGMPHPAITSYPLPRLLYIKRHFKDVRTVCQPKDLLLTALTGVRRSDVWTWRGLAHPEKGYGQSLLRSLEIPLSWLPPLGGADEVAGGVTAEGKLAEICSHAIISYTVKDETVNLRILEHELLENLNLIFPNLRVRRVHHTVIVGLDLRNRSEFTVVIAD